MDNQNTIFQNQGQNQPQSQAQAQNYGSLQNSPSVGQDGQQASANFSYSNSGRFSSFKKFLKLLIGLFVVLGIIFVSYFLISNFLKNTSGEQVTLSYWGAWEDEDIMQSVISDFEKQNPNIKVDYSREDLSQYREKLITRIKNGTGPDVFSFHNSWYSMISDVVLPVPSSVISSNEYSMVYYPTVQKDLVKNGAIYGIPLYIDTLSLFINTELLNSAGLSAPQTWNDFIVSARTMTVKDESGRIITSGASMGTFDNIDYAPDIVSMLFLQNAVDIENISDYSERTEGALTFFTSFAIDQNNVWDNTLDKSSLAFSKGNLAMYFGYYSDYFIIKQQNPNLSFEVFPVPNLPNQNITLASYWSEGVSVSGKNQKQAFEFLKFLAKKETQKKLFEEQAKKREFGRVPARVDFLEETENIKNLSSFSSQAQDARSSFFVDKTFDNGLNEELNSVLGLAINEILNRGNVGSLVEKFQGQVVAVFEKYNL